jgi:peptide/nickel transport system permease protein
MGKMAERSTIKLLARDKVALFAAIYLAVVFLAALIGPELVDGAATSINLRARNAPPFQFENGWLFWLGSDSLGRSILARIIVGSRNTIGIAVGSVLVSMLVGGIVGLMAGLSHGSVGRIIMRGVDVLMSFPSLLMAMIVLYVLGPAPVNVIIVLAITRLPIYIRTARAETLEIRERAFISAARVMGGNRLHIAVRHVAPLVLPTLLIISALDFAYVMLAESALSFLGIGVQPPEITWGLMVAEGRSYLTSAWWLAFWPGLAIMITALAANFLASWYRIANDPALRAAMGKEQAIHA